MPARRSLTTKLICVITLCSSLILVAALGYNYHRSRALLEKELESNARNLVMSLVNRVETDLASVAKVTEGVARSLECGSYSEGELLTLLRTTVERNPEIYGSGVAFEPYSHDAATRLYCPYFYREKGKVAFCRLENSYRDVPYLHQDWYQIPRELGRLEWSEPYFDDGGGNITMTTCSVPFYQGDDGSRRLTGVVTADLSLQSLTDLVSSVQVLETGYAFLLSRNGMVLAHPLQAAVMNETIFSIAEARGDPSLRMIGRRMVRGESGIVPYTSLTGVRSWMYYAPVRSTRWTLAVVFPEAELLADVNTLSMTMAAIGFAGVLLLAVSLAFMAHSITRPLRRLATATQELASGNFDVELPSVRSRDEVGMLTDAFEVMKGSLKEYIRNLTETTAAKERIQSELRMATDIQASLLPRMFPAFPDRPEFDIYAHMDPAKEVGGDFYDFFFVDEKTLCFLIADVSDKGVPAALYMMVAKTLLKTEALRALPPAEILSRVNNLLAPDNDTCMFVTVFCAILDTENGKVRFANAGHNPPLVCSGPEGFRYLKVEAGFVLGPMADSAYTTESIVLGENDIFFLYTDGVTEAKNPGSELFGEGRLLAALQRHVGDSPADLIHAIRAEVGRHADGAPQSDDVTLLAVKFKGARNAVASAVEAADALSE